MSQPFEWHLPPEEPPSRGPSRTTVLAVLAALVLGAGIATGTFLFLDRAADETSAEVATYLPVMGEPVKPVFEPVSDEGANPFFPLDVQLAGFELETGETVDATDVAQGLFGGTAEETCDPERLIRHLVEHPDQGRAWAAVQGITFAELPDYIRSLEVRVLAADAIVLNHGFDPASGAAYEVLSTLEAGTAVLIDSNGDIRTRCYCGNPIRPAPPVNEPPRCVVIPSLVATEPGSGRQRTMLRDARATGRIADVDGTTWVEINSADGAGVPGWTPAGNLVEGYCAPATTNVERCTAPGGADVFAAAEGAGVIGRLGGEVRTAETTVDASATIELVGGSADGIVENGRVLVAFSRPYPSTAESGWVDLGALTDSGCTTTTACIRTDGPVTDRAGGLPITAPGTYRVAFTGHFGGDPVTSTEVLLVDDGGAGWIANFYTPVPETDCGEVPDDGTGRRCAAPSGEQPIYRTAAADSADESNVLGIIGAAPVEVLDATATGGLVRVRIGGNGPEGWIDETMLAPPFSRCGPIGGACMNLEGDVHATWQDGDDTIYRGDGTRAAFVELFHIALYTPGPPDDLTAPVVINGEPGWVRPGLSMRSVPRLGCDRPSACADQAAVNTPSRTAPATVDCCVTGRIFDAATGATIDEFDTATILPLGYEYDQPFTSTTMAVLHPAVEPYAHVDRASVLSPDRCSPASICMTRPVAGSGPATQISCLGSGPVAPAVEPTVTPEPTTAPTTAPEPTATPQVEPTATPTPAATATPAPATTPTPAPSATPEPSPTPSCPDNDGDGVCNSDDNCPNDPNPGQENVDGQFLHDVGGDACDTCIDIDGDLACGDVDNCPEVVNYDQIDRDEDGVGDACDPCADDPTVSTGIDGCIPNPGTGPDCSDKQMYIGMPEGQAITTATNCGLATAVTRRDGLAYDRDEPGRLNFWVDNGIVVVVDGAL